MVISGIADAAVIPVTLEILGSPYLPAAIFQGMLDFGVVPLGGEAVEPCDFGTMAMELPGSS